MESLLIPMLNYSNLGFEITVISLTSSKIASAVVMLFMKLSFFVPCVKYKTKFTQIIATPSKRLLNIKYELQPQHLGTQTVLLNAFK